VKLVSGLSRERSVSMTTDLLTQEQMAEIMTAANLAIAKGYTLKTPRGTIGNMLVRNGKLASFAELLDESGKYILVSHCTLPRIVAVKSVDVEIDVIYEPSPVAKPTAASNPDLSNPSP